jgi:hypothetical protein
MAIWRRSLIVLKNRSCMFRAQYRRDNRSILQSRSKEKLFKSLLHSCTIGVTFSIPVIIVCYNFTVYMFSNGMLTNDCRSSTFPCCSKQVWSRIFVSPSLKAESFQSCNIIYVRKSETVYFISHQ